MTTIIETWPLLLRPQAENNGDEATTRARTHLFARLAVLIAALFALSACTTTSVFRSAAPYQPPSDRYAAIVINASTGKVLHETRADAIRYPASLTKMMTMYLVFDALERGRISKTTKIPISAKAAAEPASKLYLKPGTTITVDEALRTLAVKSANDVAYAVAEFMAGSEAAFARQMTSKARALGMSSTVFRNASGLPDKGQVSTARDMAKLGTALLKRFPRQFGYFSKRNTTFRGKTIRGHNRVLGRLRGANGIKTGYTRASGYNLVTSMRKNGRNYIGVILGENSGKLRDQHMVELMTHYVK
ncbi:MAG: D-alanyl-D-alanine carboxypeptidase family protein [Pseudomonadota bacterium]